MNRRLLLIAAVLALGACGKKEAPETVDAEALDMVAQAVADELNEPPAAIQLLLRQSAEKPQVGWDTLNIGVGGQARSHSVNMFTEQWPTEYESHFYANVMHDWSDETNRILAKKSFDALPSGGRIFLSEILMDDDGTGPWQAAAFALAMMAGTLGKQYSLPEFRDILESAGFTDVRARRTGGGYYSLVSARKP